MRTTRSAPQSDYMAAGTILELVYLEFGCPAGKDILLEVLQTTARLLQAEGSSSFKRRPLAGAVPGEEIPSEAEEVWERKGARISLRTTAPGEERGRQPGRLTATLQLDTGFQLEATVPQPSAPAGTLLVRLRHLWPRHFDQIRDLFRDQLGEDNDHSDAPPVALRNARAALAASQGAFARYLIDQAEAWRRARPGTAAEEQDWTLLQDLSRELRQGGPEKPEED